MASIEDQITQLWGELTAATHRFLELIAEFDRSDGWMGAGMTSCAQWLNLHCGISDVAAREKLRIAHAIAKLPKINAAFRDGKVSYSKVRAMTRVATPDNEAILLNIANHGTASHVERTVQKFRRLERIEAAELAAENHRRQSVRYRHDDDGSLLIHARLPVEVGELVRRAIERAAELAEADDQVEPDEPDYSFDRFARNRAEGLRLIAEQFLANAADSSTAGDRFQVVVHIDQPLLNHEGTEGQCEIEDGPALAIETARRLACDCSLVGITKDSDGTPLNVGRKTRAIPHAIRRALKARDGGCRFPGCTHMRFTEGHHVKHWASGGETKLENLVTLCRFHHHLVHEGGFGVHSATDRESADTFVFTRPDGEPLAESIRVEKCFRGNNLTERNRQRGIDIDASTIDSRWLGETMDYSLAIDSLIAARDKATHSAVNGSP